MSQRSTRLSYSKVARESPSCPSCGLAFQNIKLVKCLRCEFDLAKTDLIFPYAPPPMDPLMDHLQTFSEEQREGILSEFALLTQKFPQISIALCNLNLISTTDPRVFGFWMLNRSPLGKDETAEQRTFTMLIVIDQENQRLSASAGLALEPFLPSTEISRALEHSFRHWFYNDPIEGAQILTQELHQALLKSIDFLKRNKITLD